MLLAGVICGTLWRMTKTEAKLSLGGTMRSLAEACGLTINAVKKWPQQLTRKQIDTVQAALFRKIEKVMK